jgi:phosphoribosylaminoimidazole (AIR) synthetase
MRTVFNMGVGMTVVVREAEVERTIEVLRSTGAETWRLGTAVADAERRVWIREEGLVGRSKRFAAESE